MPTSQDIRTTFLEFFRSKEHLIVPSAPIVVKNDPTLMFTNAGMNQFKDAFLGNSKPDAPRVADTQKCLRVSGKHNDLEEVGVDTYHHTMFEMLGNWSFGDYFKMEAIAFAWELLTGRFGIDRDRLYITVFKGDEADGLEADEESAGYWQEWVDKDRILYFDRKDNFWEMGETGPCGPCSEIHVDIRPEAERAGKDGAGLVNADHPQVIEIWNLVFIQYNRLADGSLRELPQKHVDTGMGFERLCMVLQEAVSSYDTDIFTPIIREIESLTGHTYGKERGIDIAFRVVSDHIRAIAFAIADGQLPSNTGAGYVIRRILRRAVRYYYNFLDRKEPMMAGLVDVLGMQFKGVFNELTGQTDFIKKVIEEEETNFLRTLANGLSRLANLMEEHASVLPGEAVFELYDTYGFPLDLTRLIVGENGVKIDETGFEAALEAQRNRSRQAAVKESGDWTVLEKGEAPVFVGYDSLEERTRVLRYRHVTEKKNDFTQVVLEQTPFYAESGGQQGDRGQLVAGERTLQVVDTKKENDLIIHYIKGKEDITESDIVAKVHASNRALSCKNHSATHLLHAALRQVLGDHVEQKGSFLNADHLRFDFSHFAKMADEEVRNVENIVNRKVFENIELKEFRNMEMDKAMDMGAMALFGEKYGDSVRVIVFDPEFSVELCGGTHVQSTGEIGLFKITQETAVAAGVRRIEAVTGPAALQHLNAKADILDAVNEALKHPADTLQAVHSLQKDNHALRKQLDAFERDQWTSVKNRLKREAEMAGDTMLILESVRNLSADGLKKIAFDLKNETGPVIALIGSSYNDKALLGLVISESLVDTLDLNAGKLIKEFARHIKGGGGGQPFFATAGGPSPEGIPEALEAARSYFEKVLH